VGALRGVALACELALVTLLYQVVCQSGSLDTQTTSQDAFLPHALFAVGLGLACALADRPATVEPSPRSAALRAIACGLLLALVNAVVLAFVDYHVAIQYRSWSACAALTGALVGLAAGPLVLLEAFPLPRGARNDADSGLATFGVASLLMVLVGLEVHHVSELLRTGSFPEALVATADFAKRLHEEPLSVAYRVLPYAIPFALLAVARRRTSSLVRQTEIVVVGSAGLLVAWSFFRPGFEYVSVNFMFFPLRRGAILLTAGALPLGARLAELVEARWFTSGPSGAGRDPGDPLVRLHERGSHGDPEPEAAPLPDLAVDADLALVREDHVARDREAEARAARR
jgi:hypothetical protein